VVSTPDSLYTDTHPLSSPATTTLALGEKRMHQGTTTCPVSCLSRPPPSSEGTRHAHVLRARHCRPAVDNGQATGVAQRHAGARTGSTRFSDTMGSRVDIDMSQMLTRPSPVTEANMVDTAGDQCTSPT